MPACPLPNNSLDYVREVLVRDVGLFLFRLSVPGLRTIETAGLLSLFLPRSPRWGQGNRDEVPAVHQSSQIKNKLLFMLESLASSPEADVQRECSLYIQGLQLKGDTAKHGKRLAELPMITEAVVRQMTSRPAS